MGVPNEKLDSALRIAHREVEYLATGQTATAAYRNRARQNLAILHAAVTRGLQSLGDVEVETCSTCGGSGDGEAFWTHSDGRHFFFCDACGGTGDAK